MSGCLITIPDSRFSAQKPRLVDMPCGRWQDGKNYEDMAQRTLETGHVLKFRLRALDSTPSSLFQWFASIHLLPFHSLPAHGDDCGIVLLAAIPCNPQCSIGILPRSSRVWRASTHCWQHSHLKLKNIMHSSTTGLHTRPLRLVLPPRKQQAHTKANRLGEESQSIHVCETYYKKNTRKKQLR